MASGDGVYPNKNGFSYLNGQYFGYIPTDIAHANSALGEWVDISFSFLSPSRYIGLFAKVNAGTRAIAVAKVSQKIAAAAKKGYKSIAELGLTDGMKVSESKALELGQEFLGKGYKEVGLGTGRYVSADSSRVFRMGASDITGAHGGGPHVNFETLIPNPAKLGKLMVDQNIHIYLIK